MYYWCNFGVNANLSTSIKSKNRLNISLEPANLQEHYSIILQVRIIVCVAVMAINCMLFMTRNNINYPVPHISNYQQHDSPTLYPMLAMFLKRCKISIVQL